MIIVYDFCKCSNECWSRYWTNLWEEAYANRICSFNINSLLIEAGTLDHIYFDLPSFHFLFSSSRVGSQFSLFFSGFAVCDIIWLNATSKSFMDNTLRSIFSNSFTLIANFFFIGYCTRKRQNLHNFYESIPNPGNFFRCLRIRSTSLPIESCCSLSRCSH